MDAPTRLGWIELDKEIGAAGVVCRRPHRSPGRKVLEPEEQLIRSCAASTSSASSGSGSSSSAATARTGCRTGQSSSARAPGATAARCPCDRVQLDTGKIAPGLYQHAAIDDRCRWQVLALYPSRDAASTLDFLDKVRAGMPFLVQRVQTDRGGELFAYKVQHRQRGWHIKLRPNRPRAPRLNGKVERVQRTALEEFWPTAGLSVCPGSC